MNNITIPCSQPQGSVKPNSQAPTTNKHSTNTTTLALMQSEWVKQGILAQSYLTITAPITYTVRMLPTYTTTEPISSTDLQTTSLGKNTACHPRNGTIPGKPCCPGECTCPTWTASMSSTLVVYVGLGEMASHS